MSERVPIYLKVYDLLRKSIDNNEYLPGQLLPSEPVLEEKYGVSRITVRKAINLLASDGYVFAKQGVGTIVSFPIMQKPSYVTSFSETLRAAGYEPSSKDIHLSCVTPPEIVSEMMGVGEPSEMICLQRLHLADNKPIAIMTNYIRPEVVQDIDKHELNFVSLYNFLEEKYGITINASRDFITATVANLAQANILEIPIGSPLIYLRRVSFLDGRPVLVDVVYINANMYVFSFSRVGKSPKLGNDSARSLTG